MNIRKVHNDKIDSKKLALIGLKPDLKVSVIPSEAVFDLRNLVREYYNLMDSRVSYVNKLSGVLKVSFPLYRCVFSKVTTMTSLALLENFQSPSDFLLAGEDAIVNIIRNTARFGEKYAKEKYQTLVKAVNSAASFGHFFSSNTFQIRLCVSFIRQYDEAISAVLLRIRELVDIHSDKEFVRQIRLVESIPRAGFLTAVTIIAEIGDFFAFTSPKQLFAFFGLDPAVKQSGKFVGTQVKMSKRGSAIARRAIYTIALVSIGVNRKGVANNLVLRDCYLLKCKSKPKMVALGVVMHKVCNIIFALLRDGKEFCIVTPEEHKANYLLGKLAA